MIVRRARFAMRSFIVSLTVNFRGFARTCSLPTASDKYRSRALPHDRLHNRPHSHEDLHVLLPGEYISRAEIEAYEKYRSELTYAQWFTANKIRLQLLLRHSFIHGKVRNVLTYMALYAAGCEVAHDFHLDHYLSADAAWFLSLFHTRHAVGLIALSHVSEHVKEMLRMLTSLRIV